MRGRRTVSAFEDGIERTKGTNDPEWEVIIT